MIDPWWRAELQPLVPTRYYYNATAARDSARTRSAPCTHTHTHFVSTIQIQRAGQKQATVNAPRRPPRHALLVVRSAPRRLHDAVGSVNHQTGVANETHLHRARDVDVCPPDGRLVGAVGRLDALDEGLEEERGGAAPRAFATRLWSVCRQGVSKQGDEA